LGRGVFPPGGLVVELRDCDLRSLRSVADTARRTGSASPTGRSGPDQLADGTLERRVAGNSPEGSGTAGRAAQGIYLGTGTRRGRSSTCLDSTYTPGRWDSAPHSFSIPSHRCRALPWVDCMRGHRWLSCGVRIPNMNGSLGVDVEESTAPRVRILSPTRHSSMRRMQSLDWKSEPHPYILKIWPTTRNSPKSEIRTTPLHFEDFPDFIRKGLATFR
jgi:hypothetical protein